jgi:hypothetical protein
MSNNNRDPTKDLSRRTIDMSTKNLYITLPSFHPTSQKQGQSPPTTTTKFGKKDCKGQGTICKEGGSTPRKTKAEKKT